VYSLALNKRQYVTRITLKCFFDVTNSAIVCYIERYRTFVSLNESVRGGERGNQRSDCDRGGINGAGIAADAAGRGLSVLMLEASDLACATSSASSKLIHGGLRYLEHYEFRLVSEALAEREVLLKMAPHIAFPMRFRLPHRPHLRPAWMIRIGLFMYDHLGKRTSLPGSTGLRFGTESVLKPEIVRGFEYSDCWVDDARLVLANAQMVVRKGGKCARGPAPSRQNVKTVCGLSKPKILIAARSLPGRRAVWLTPPARGSNSSSTKGCICARRTVFA
jgi:glycerol-3-phosphate dehydrogenase